MVCRRRSFGSPTRPGQSDSQKPPDRLRSAHFDALLLYPVIHVVQKLFLPETWRLAPSICTFTSEVFYEGRLHPHTGCERQMLVGTPPFEVAGLWVVPVEHDGNQNSSSEEVGVVDRIVASSLRANGHWIGPDGVDHSIAPSDILIVAPYNSHNSLLTERVGPRGVRIGTVDRFQGQEAPVVIYSMATSRPEDAPHGMEFLYSLNRLNVATSRAPARGSRKR
jgi:superfamily I DNA and/or RNA helicase